MANTKNKPASKYDKKSLSRDDIRKTWAIKPPKLWLNLLKEVSPSQQWEMAGHTTIKGKCPYHTDRTASFVLSFDKAMGKCFGAGCEKVVVDITNLVAKLKNCNYTEALMFIYNRFEMGELLPEMLSDRTEYHKVQEAKKEFAVGLSKITQVVLSECPDYLTYCKPALEYLINVRKLPAEVLHLLPVGVWVKPMHMEPYISANLLPVIKEYFAKAYTGDYAGSLCFYYNDSPGSISRFKLRHPEPEIMHKLKSFDDYANLPFDDQEKLFHKGNSQYLEDAYSNDIGIYGLYTYQSLIGKKDPNAYLTEGEFDALSVMAAQLKTGSVDFMLFACGGKGNTDVQFLRDFGIRALWLIPDHPSKQGDDWAESLLVSKSNFTASAGVTPLHFKLFQWPVAVKGGDLDEAVKEHGYDGLLEYLFVNRNSYFLDATEWVKARTDQAIAAVNQKCDLDKDRVPADVEKEVRDTAFKNIEVERREQIEAAVLKGFRFIHSPADKQSFVQKYSAENGIDVSAIASVQASMYALDTIQGVVDRVNDHLKQYFELAYYQRRTGDTAIFAWSKKANELVEIPTAEKPLLKTIAVFTDQEIEQWFDKMLGYNPIYCEGVDEGDQSLSASKKKRSNAKLIVEKAFEQQMCNLTSYDNMSILSQGIQFRDLPRNVQRDGVLYFVNGSHVFRGQFSKSGDDLEWQRIFNAADGDVLFEDLSRKRKWSCVEDITDLQSAAAVDLAAVYRDIRHILNGWVFQNHDIAAEYLAAYIMSIPIMRAIADINITLLTGDAASGKTTFSAGLLGGSGAKQNVCPHILESVFQVDNTTLPALYQSMEGKSHLVVFDEAERNRRYNTQYDNTMDEILRLVHSMPYGGVNVKRGGKDKNEGKEYFLRFPMLMAAIDPPSDPVFLSRTYEIRTRKQDGHMPAEEFIEREFTPAQLQALRRNITIGLLPKIPELIAIRQKLSVDLQQVGARIAKVSNRFLTNLLTPLAVYQLVGGDPTELYKSIVSCDINKIEAIHSMDPQNDLLNTCLYTKCIKMSGDNIVDSVSAQSLLVNQHINILNNSGSGVYFVPELEAIIIAWRQAKFGALANTRYAGWDVSTLREHAQKSDLSWGEISPAHHELIKMKLNLQDIHSRSGYSVVDISYLIAEPLKLDDADLEPKADKDPEPPEGFMDYPKEDVKEEQPEVQDTVEDPFDFEL
jgi:hypothetical protein